MARIRSIFPGLFTDEAFMDLTPMARLLVIGLWTEAYDDGVFDWKPRVLKARLFPADTCDVAPLLDELVAVDIVRKVERNGVSYGLIRNFAKYQRPQKPKPSGVTTPDDRRYLGAKRDPSDTGPAGITSGDASEPVSGDDESGEVAEFPLADGEDRPSGDDAGTRPVRDQSATGRVPVSDQSTTGRGISNPIGGWEDGRMEDGEDPPPKLQPGTRSERVPRSFDRASADQLEARLRDAAGYQSSPAPSLRILGPIEILIGDGFDLETEILPVIRARAASLPRPAQSWSYFVAAIREARDRALGGRSRDAPEASIDRRMAEARAKLAKRKEGAR